MEDSTLTYSIITSITTIVGPIITWLLARKKYASEVDNNVIANMKESLEFYKQLSDDNKARLDDALKRSAKLEQEVNDLRKQVATLSMILAGYGLQEKHYNENIDEHNIDDSTEEPDAEVD
jgi:peptidoglycan hydrolase CwlO-like protein